MSISSRASSLAYARSNHNCVLPLAFCLNPSRQCDALHGRRHGLTAAFTFFLSHIFLIHFARCFLKPKKAEKTESKRGFSRGRRKAMMRSAVWINIALHYPRRSLLRAEYQSLENVASFSPFVSDLSLKRDEFPLFIDHILPEEE
jgi:hypothetical protein